jgi:hypothetical protein
MRESDVNNYRFIICDRSITDIEDGELLLINAYFNRCYVNGWRERASECCPQYSRVNAMSMADQKPSLSLSYAKIDSIS